MPSSERSPELLAEEHDLVRAAQAGDRPAFAVLVERYWERLYRYLYHLTRDRHAAEDLAQDTFLKAFTRLEKFQAGTNLGGWLFRVGHNIWANQHRGAARRREPLTDDRPAPEPGPPEQAAGREALREVERVVARLPVEYRAALMLRAEGGLSFREIADVLDLTEETARWRVFKARQKLLALLAPRQEQETP